MSVRSENSYRAFAARQAEAATSSSDAQLIRDLNAIPKDPGAETPFGDILFVQGHGGWWAECPVTGFGYWYATLRRAVRAWNVAVFLDSGRLIGQPMRIDGETST
jgi:hypothetical protein